MALTLNYLQGSLPNANTPSSLSYGLLGLAAHTAQPPEANAWLAKCYAATVRRGASPYALALLALAAYEGEHPFATPVSSLAATAS
jgi:hypothetical protein